MQDNASRIATASALAVAAMALLTVLFARDANATPRNLTAGGELRPGVYGRIDPGRGAPPPLVFKQARVAAPALQAAGVQPVYLYVPPGQLRKWDQHCVKWQACALPVFFVRVDDSPSRLGQWSRLRDSVAMRSED